MTDPISRLNAALEGRYTVGRQLGEGGMATVYLADDLKHERKVALKVLKPELAAVVGAERFLAEIKTTANLQHPHILPLFDSGEADGFLFYVMPYVQGETLRDRMEREKQLPVDEGVRIATAVANALDHAHRHGVIHRDIKPANILLQDGEPVVADFGIALAVGAAGGSRMTETGLSIGTPYYMSPEQATGDQIIGPASDLYALACVLYEMLVGEPPYLGNTAQAVLGKIIAGAPVSPTELRPTIPPNVDAAIRRALEKLPADRFTSAQEFSKALSEPAFQYGEAAVGVGAPGSPWNRLSMAMTALAALFGAGLAWSAFGPEPPPAPATVERFSMAVREDQGANPNFNISPGGSALVYQGPGDATPTQLWLRRIDNLTPAPLQGTDGGGTPVISPDGEEVAFMSAGQLKVAPLKGGVVRTLADSAVCCARWGGDGYIYFSPVNRAISRVPVSGGPVEAVTDRDQEGDGQHGDFQVLPGGEVAVFTVWGTPARIEAMRLATGERTVLTPGVKPYFTPTGHLVFAALEGQILAAPFDPETMELTGSAVPLVEEVIVSGNQYPFYSLSQNGTLVYWAGTAGAGNSEPVWVTRSGVATPVDPGWVGSFFTPAISPDGTQLAIAVGSSEGRDIWIKQLDRGPLARLTFPDGQDHRPWWTPDGRELVFITERGESRDAYRKRADGVGEADVVLDLEQAVNQAFFSPDGNWLVYRTGRVDALDIYAQRLDGDSAAIPIMASPTVNEHSPALSPDGSWLAYVSDESGRWELYVRPFPHVDDGRWLVSTDGGSEPVWSGDGRELFYKNREGELVATEVVPGASFATGDTEVLFSTQPYYDYAFTPQYDVTSDGERFLMIRLSAGADDARLIFVQNWFEELRERVGN